MKGWLGKPEAREQAVVAVAVAEQRGRAASTCERADDDDTEIDELKAPVIAYSEDL